MEHQQIFNEAFAEPGNTTVDMPPIIVNRILHSGSYKVNPSITYTRTHLWDMEVKKAHNPDLYLRHILRPGSLQIFDVVKNGPVETFIRVTDQKAWTDPSKYTTVIERVSLDSDTHQAFFIGVPEIDGPDGRKIVSGKEQPIFHVEHSASGTEREPQNIWRIVFLDKDENGELQETFKRMAASPYLREFIEVHIREVLGEGLVRVDLK